MKRKMFIFLLMIVMLISLLACSRQDTNTGEALPPGAVTLQHEAEQETISGIPLNEAMQMRRDHELNDFLFIIRENGQLYSAQSVKVRYLENTGGHRDGFSNEAKTSVPVLEVSKGDKFISFGSMGIYYAYTATFESYAFPGRVDAVKEGGMEVRARVIPSPDGTRDGMYPCVELDGIKVEGEKALSDILVEKGAYLKESGYICGERGTIFTAAYNGDEGLKQTDIELHAYYVIYNTNDRHVINAVETDEGYYLLDTGELDIGETYVIHAGWDHYAIKIA